jgi:hypothetical protein
MKSVNVGWSHRIYNSPGMTTGPFDKRPSKSDRWPAHLWLKPEVG